LVSVISIELSLNRISHGIDPNLHLVLYLDNDRFILLLEGVIWAYQGFKQTIHKITK